MVKCQLQILLLKRINLKKLSNIQSKSFELSLLLSIPASFGLILASNEIVNALSKDDNLGAESTFKSVMQQKVGDALEMKRREVANNIVNMHQASIGLMNIS